LNSRLQTALLLLLLLIFVLPACSTMPPQDVDQARRLELHDIKSERVKKQTSWSLSGKLAISDGKDGGSGKLNWHSGPNSIRMDFHGAMGRGAWRLEADAEGARLELADGKLHQARTVNLLVSSQLGWEVPVDSLAWWVRGLADPGDKAERIIDAQGNLSQLIQDGWTVEYGSYRSFEGLDLPLRLTARQQDWKVKLVVREWDMTGKTDPDG
jgi:outer membrane lipoprotein LolB